MGCRQRTRERDSWVGGGGTVRLVRKVGGAVGVADHSGQLSRKNSRRNGVQHCVWRAFNGNSCTSVAWDEHVGV